MANVNYGALYIKGRSKTPSSPWSDEEIAYITEHGSIDMARVEELRNEDRLKEAHKVIEELDPAQTEQSEAGSEPLEAKSLQQLTKEEALANGLELGLAVEASMHRSTIIALIREKLNSESKLPTGEEVSSE